MLDEAYTEYLDPAQRFDSVQWVRRFPNLLVSRTFSKAYGLAGLRIGYGIAQPALTNLMNRVRAAFNVNALAQAAAVAALGDQAFLDESYRVNRAGYRQLTDAFDAAGIAYIPSSGNFVLFKAGEAADAGAKVNLALLRQGVIVRPVAQLRTAAVAARVDRHRGREPRLPRRAVDGAAGRGRLTHPVARR